MEEGVKSILTAQLYIKKKKKKSGCDGGGRGLQTGQAAPAHLLP